MLFLNQDLPEYYTDRNRKKLTRSNPLMRTNKYFISQRKIGFISKDDCKESLSKSYLPLVEVKIKNESTIETSEINHGNYLNNSERHKNLLLMNRKWIDKIEKFVYLFNKNLKMNDLPQININSTTSSSKVENIRKALNLQFKSNQSLFITDPGSVSKYKLSNSKGKQLSLIKEDISNLKKSSISLVKSPFKNKEKFFSQLKKTYLKTTNLPERRKINPDTVGKKVFSSKDLIEMRLKHR